MARYTASFTRTTSNNAVQDDGDCCKKRQNKEGSDDIRFMTYHNEKMPVQVKCVLVSETSASVHRNN